MRTHHVDNGQRNPQPFKFLLPNQSQCFGGELQDTETKGSLQRKIRNKKKSLMIDHLDVLRCQDFSRA